MFDRATDWLQCLPSAKKTAKDTIAAFNLFQGPTQKVKNLYCDNAPELLKAARHMKWNVDTGTPGQPMCNGLAERKVRDAKEGGRTNLVQSGLGPAWWTYAVKHHCYASNIDDTGGDCPYLQIFSNYCTANTNPIWRDG